MNALLVLGYSYQSLSAALSPIILACIPFSHRISFNRVWKKSEQDFSCQLECLMSFLDEQSILLEESSFQEKFSLLNISGKQAQKNEGKLNRNSKEQKEPSEKAEKKSSKFSFGATVPKPDHSCIFCQKDHASGKCTKSMTPEDRRKCVAAVNGCLRCFRRNHDIKKCRKKGNKCPKCSEKHNVLVCTKKIRRSSQRHLQCRTTAHRSIRQRH